MNSFIRLFLCSLISTPLFSQNCSSFVWFKPGAVLEYDAYMPNGGNGSENSVRVLRITFNVDSIADSSGKRFAFITKKGEGLKKNNSYERQLKVVCDDGRIGFETNHFTPDTIFHPDYPVLAFKKYTIAIASGGGMFFPFSAAKSVGSIQTMKVAPNTYHYMQTGIFEQKPLLTMESDYVVKSKIIRLQLLGADTLSSPAGTFICSKLLLVTEFEFKTFNKEIITHIYYNKEVGIVKWEEGGSYSMLTRIDVPKDHRNSQ
jgi:hypothetical protein